MHTQRSVHVTQSHECMVADLNLYDNSSKRKEMVVQQVASMPDGCMAATAKPGRRYMSARSSNVFDRR